MLAMLLMLQTAVTDDPGPKIDLAPIVLKTMRATLLDPESARDLRICEPKLAKDAWAYLYSYRSKNAMGGYVFDGYATIVKDGKITGTIGDSDEIGRSMLSMTSACPMIDATRLAEAMK